MNSSESLCFLALDGIASRLTRGLAHRPRLPGLWKRFVRTIPVTLGVVVGVVVPGLNGQAATIAVDYTLAGQILQQNTSFVAPFVGTATIQYQGAGLATLSPGPVQLLSGSQSILFDFVFTGAWNLTGTSSQALTGSGNLAPNGALTLLVQRVVTSGHAHCLDLTPQGCQSFLMLPASTPLPLTGNSSSVALALQNPGVGQPPATLEFVGSSVSCCSTFGPWTFSEILGSRRIVPEPSTAALVGLGLLGLAMARATLETRRRRSARAGVPPAGSRRRGR